MPPGKSQWPLTDTNESIETCINLRLDPTLVKQLKLAIEENRAVRRAERQADAEFDHLYSRDISLSSDIERLGNQIEKLTSHGTSADREKLQSLQQKLLAAQRGYERVAGKRRAVNQEVQNRCLEQSVNVDTILRAFEEILVDNDMIDPRANSDCEDSVVGVESHATNDSIRDTNGSIHEASNSISVKGRSAIEYRCSSSEDGSLDISKETGETRELVGYYEAMGRKLQVSQNVLDRREHFLGPAREKRRRKIAAGEEVQPQLEFDLHELQRNRNGPETSSKAKARLRSQKGSHSRWI
ncbi:hypothetical protein LTR37_008076 [Vermiconidia calcicola]|uniref:Uncharacterized protein n=1 Tax=Vermiconidia calcicola TaxID=1690605 RepID=A0ACC3NCU3_9PEZI|nr:hypothetical protein LTR37_008076 [Vermiconidia calcicola]